MKVNNLFRLIWLLSLSFLAGYQLRAQRLHFGPIVGISIANFKWQPENYVDSEPRLGLLAGAFGSIDLENRIRLRCDPAFSQKGSRATYAIIFTDSSSGLDVRNDYEVRADLSYIEFPLLFSYIVKREENQLGSLDLGVYGGWLLTAEAANLVQTNFANQVFRNEYRLGRSDFRTVDFGLVAGISLYFYNFDLNLRYSWGLRKTIVSEHEFITRFMNPVNRSLILGLGYQIR